MDPAKRITRNGQTLSARAWQYLEASYRAAGLEPDEFLVVTQGAYKDGHGASASGSTHDGAGAADLRVWNLPESARANLCQTLVVELRRRGGAAWYRDENHGGMEPHIHVIIRGEAPLSSGATSQLRDYDAERNGLANKGPDYHPRPAWTLYAYQDPDAPGQLKGKDLDVLLVSQQGRDAVYLLSGNQLSLIHNPADRDALKAAGVPGPVQLSAGTFESLSAAKD